MKVAPTLKLTKEELALLLKREVEIKELLRNPGISPLRRQLLEAQLEGIRAMLEVSK